MKLYHAPALAVALPTWLLALLWLWPRAVMAESLSAEFKGYDWTSVLYASALGLLGGALALIVALATDRRVVHEVLVESGRNAMVSPIAGAAAYLGLKAAAAMGWFTISTEPRFLVIVASGFAGIAFFQWVRGLGIDGAASFRAWIVERWKA